jgi:AAA family ATP:ADP antiporter
MTARGKERRAVVGATATGFLVLVAHALLETSRDALFLSNVPASRLPWMYLSLAVIGLSVSELAVRGGRGLDTRRLLVASQLIAAAGTLAIGLFVGTATPLAYYALYLWVGVASMSVLVRYWQHLSGEFTVTDAKRIFPLVGTGSVAGALVGYALAETLAQTVGVTASIPVAAAFFALSAIGPLAFFGASRPDASTVDQRERAGVAESVRIVLSQKYLRRVAAVLVVASLTVTLADFVFKSVVADEVAPGAMGSFFARAYFAFNVVSLFVLIALVNPIVQQLGVTRSLALLPAMLVVASMGVVATGGIVAAIALKSVDGAFRFSTHKTAVELLYVPMSSRLRDTVKSAMDVLAQRMGQALGSLLILATLLLSDSVRLPAVLVAACSIAWLALALSLKQTYLDLFRDTLDRGPDSAVLEFPDLDVGSLETLVAALSSPQDEKVVAAIDLLEQKAKGHLVPGLVLYHPAPSVVARALDLFARTRRKDVLPLLARLAEHEYAEVRAAALRASTALAPDEAVLRSALQHHCPVVNVTAIVGLTVGGWIPVTEGVEALLRHADQDSELARPMIARAIQYHPLSAFAPVLERLAKDLDPETRRQAVLAMRAARNPNLVPTLIRALRERALREDARDALVALGSPALAALESALADPTTPISLRMHLPRTVARFRDQRAAEILVRQLVADQGGMIRYKALRGLGRMVANDPSLRLDGNALDDTIRSTITSLFQRLHWQTTLQAGAEAMPTRRTPGHELLLQLLRDKEALAIERLFRMLGLRYRGEDWANVYDGLSSEDPIARASGRELVESALPRDLGKVVVALTDDGPPLERLQVGAEYYASKDFAYDELVDQLIGHPGETVKLIARYHAVEIGLRPDTEGFVHPAEDGAGWVESLRELATRMQRDLPARRHDPRSHA